MISKTVSVNLPSKDVNKRELPNFPNLPKLPKLSNGSQTKSRDCVIKLKSQSKPSVLIDLLKGFKAKVDIFSHDLQNQRTKIDNNEFFRFLEEQGCTLALKIFRGKNPKEVFINELARASLVRSAIGNENFYTYTTYRFFNDSCGFVIRPAKDSKIRLSLQHKHNMTNNHNNAEHVDHLDEIYIILNEACAYSLENLKPDAKSSSVDIGMNTGNKCNRPADRFDAQEMDQSISKVLKVLHENGIVHKDIKPANIVYCPFSYVRYKLVDYALAATSTVIPKTMSGSKAFMSPFYVAYMAKSIIQKQRGQYLDTDKILSLYDAQPGYSRYYKVLIRGHLVSLRRSKQLDAHGYLELKNDEYAYMMTLFSIYTQVRDPVLLARATGMSMCTNPVFA